LIISWIRRLFIKLPKRRPISSVILRSCFLAFTAFLLLQAGAGFAQTFDESLSLARSGDVFAQNQTGTNYYYGQGVPVDKAKAAEWFEKAVRGGLPWSAGILSEMYEAGDGVKKNKEKARFYKEEADQFTINMMSNPEKYKFIDAYLGQVERDGMRELLVNAQSGQLDAQRELAQNLAAGSNGFERNNELAFTWYKKAADQGDGMSMYAVSLLLISSETVAPDLSPQATIDEAVAWMKKALAAGSVLPADLSQLQKLTPADLNERRLSARLSDASDVLLCTPMKTLPCTNDDKRNALNVYKQAADTGDPWAQYLWGEALLQSDNIHLLGQSPDVSAGMAYLTKASEADVPEAQMLLARHFQRGDLSEKNIPEAIKLYDRVVAHYKSNNISGGDGSEAECRLHFLRGDLMTPYQLSDCQWVASE
jgi:TPR repeat protein